MPTLSPQAVAGHRGKMPIFSELLANPPAAPVQPAAEPSVYQNSAPVSISTISSTMSGPPRHAGVLLAYDHYMA